MSSRLKAFKQPFLAPADGRLTGTSTTGRAGTTWMHSNASSHSIRSLINPLSHFITLLESSLRFFLSFTLISPNRSFSATVTPLCILNFTSLFPTWLAVPSLPWLSKSYLSNLSIVPKASSANTSSMATRAWSSFSHVVPNNLTTCPSSVNPFIAAFIAKINLACSGPKIPGGT